MHRPTNREIAPERRMMRADYATAECDDAIPFLLRHETAMKRIFANDTDLGRLGDNLLGELFASSLRGTYLFPLHSVNKNPPIPLK
jgi:hypothetical protein